MFLFETDEINAEAPSHFLDDDITPVGPYSNAPAMDALISPDPTSEPL